MGASLGSVQGLWFRRWSDPSWVIVVGQEADDSLMYGCQPHVIPDRRLFVTGGCSPPLGNNLCCLLHVQSRSSRSLPGRPSVSPTRHCLLHVQFRSSRSLPMHAAMFLKFSNVANCNGPGKWPRQTFTTIQIDLEVQCSLACQVKYQFTYEMIWLHPVLKLCCLKENV